jgi:hypothetical protein
MGIAFTSSEKSYKRYKTYTSRLASTAACGEQSAQSGTGRKFEFNRAASW